MRLLARVILKLFFRRIEVEGRSDVPATGPVLFVCNHTNAFVDPLLLIITLRRRVTLTAKNILAGNPLVRPLMKGMGIITFHRRADAAKGADVKQNVHSLDQCRAVLRRGGAVCIFPEGVSHSDPGLRPFRTGAARIALDYVHKDGNPGQLQFVPVGLLYTEKDQFRSAIWLRFGEPLDAGAWLAEHGEADAASLTEELRRRVEAVTMNYETRRESAILSWGAEILATDGAAPPPLGWRERPVSAWFQLLARLQAGYRSLVTTCPDEVEALTRRVRQYRGELKRLAIAPGEVYLPMHHGKALFFLFRELELALIGAPLALVGFVNHAAPYYLVKWIARKLSRDRDHWATNVVFPSLAIFPFFYLVQIGAAWLWLPALWATLYSIALPYTGYVALLYGERVGAMFRRLRTFWYFWRHRQHQDELAREGRSIIAAIQALNPKR